MSNPENPPVSATERVTASSMVAADHDTFPAGPSVLGGPVNRAEPPPMPNSNPTAAPGTRPRGRPKKTDNRPSYKDRKKSHHAAPKPAEAPIDPPDFSHLNGGAPPKAEEPINPNQPEAPQIDHEAIAGALFDKSTDMAAMVFGAQWKEEDAAQRNGVVYPLAAYLKTKEMRDIPPGWLLVIAILAYSAPRLAHPVTQSRFAMLFERAVLAWAWIKFHIFRIRQSVKVAGQPYKGPGG